MVAEFNIRSGMASPSMYEPQKCGLSLTISNMGGLCDNTVLWECAVDYHWSHE